MSLFNLPLLLAGEFYPTTSEAWPFPPSGDPLSSPAGIRHTQHLAELLRARSHCLVSTTQWSYVALHSTRWSACSPWMVDGGGWWPSPNSEESPCLKIDAYCWWWSFIVGHSFVWWRPFWCSCRWIYPQMNPPTQQPWSLGGTPQLLNMNHPQVVEVAPARSWTNCNLGFLSDQMIYWFQDRVLLMVDNLDNFGLDLLYVLSYDCAIDCRYFFVLCAIMIGCTLIWCFIPKNYIIFFN